jgi:hypothetical protein
MWKVSIVVTDPNDLAKIMALGYPKMEIETISEVTEKLPDKIGGFEKVTTDYHARARKSAETRRANQQKKQAQAKPSLSPFDQNAIAQSKNKAFRIIMKKVFDQWDHDTTTITVAGLAKEIGCEDWELRHWWKTQTWGGSTLTKEGVAENLALLADMTEEEVLTTVEKHG